MPAPLCQIETKGDDQPIDEVVAAVAWHNGDKDATIRTLLDDCRHLREQLALTEVSMSIGFSRGWRPSPERQTGDQA